MGIGMMITSGATLVLKSVNLSSSHLQTHSFACSCRRKFSASQFWPDCREHKVTVIQYIGELCRYLLAQPPDKLDRVNNVRLRSLNGNLVISLLKQTANPMCAVRSATACAPTFGINSSRASISRWSAAVIPAITFRAYFLLAAQIGEFYGRHAA